MKTAKEMYKYCTEKGYRSGVGESWALRHFKVLEKNFSRNEEVYMTSIGLKDFISMGKHDYHYSYAITK